MLILKPSKEIKKAYPKINWDTLSLVYTAILDTVYKRKKKRTWKMQVKLTNRDYSWYCFVAKHPSISLTTDLNESMVHRVMLHEFRHFIQDKILKIPMQPVEYDRLYRKHPIEIDAVNYEIKGLPYAIRLYNRIQKQKTLFSKINDYAGATKQTNRNGHSSRSKLRAKGKSS